MRRAKTIQSRNFADARRFLFSACDKRVTGLIFFKKTSIKFNQLTLQTRKANRNENALGWLFAQTGLIIYITDNM